jgi:hypothetical protein
MAPRGDWISWSEEMLAREPWEMLAPMGFERHGGRRFRRTSENVVQEIQFDVSGRPVGKPGMLQVLGQVDEHVPLLEHAARGLVGREFEKILLTVNRVDFDAIRTIPSAPWVVLRTREAVLDLSGPIARVLDNIALYLDRRRTVQDLLSDRISARREHADRDGALRNILGIEDDEGDDLNAAYDAMLAYQLGDAAQMREIVEEFRDQGSSEVLETAKQELRRVASSLA